MVPEVAEEHPIDPAVGHERAEGFQLRLRVGHHAEHEGATLGGQDTFDAGDERGKEGVGRQHIGIPGDHQTEGVRALGGQRPGAK